MKKLEISQGCLPRAAAALLRVSLERLTEELGQTQGNLNTRIKKLKEKGLPELIINSLDIVRITANEGGAHAGQIDLTGKDGPEIVSKLFGLVNFIIEKTISDPKQIQKMHQNLSPKPKNKGLRIETSHKNQGKHRYLFHSKKEIHLENQLIFL